MVISKQEAARLVRNGATLKKKPKKVIVPKPKPEIDLSQSSDAMKAAIRAADAAVSTAQAANGLIERTIEINKKLVTDVIEVIQGNQVTKLKVNRGKDKLIKDVDLIRNNA